MADVPHSSERVEYGVHNTFVHVCVQDDAAASVHDRGRSDSVLAQPRAREAVEADLREREAVQAELQPAVEQAQQQARGQRSTERNRKKRPGPGERSIFKEADVTFDVVSHANDASFQAFVDSLPTGSEGRKYVAAIRLVLQGGDDSIVLLMKYQTEIIGCIYLSIVGRAQSALVYVDATTKPEFQSLPIIADVLRWAFINVFSRFGQFLPLILRDLSTHFTLVAPLPIDSCLREHVANVLVTNGLSAMPPDNSAQIVAAIEEKLPTITGMVELTGRIWMIFGPATPLELACKASSVWPGPPRKRKLEDLTDPDFHLDSKAVTESPSTSSISRLQEGRGVLRRLTNDGESIVSEFLYGVLQVCVRPSDHDRDPVIHTSRDIHVVFYCNDLATDTFGLRLHSVLAEAELQYHTIKDGKRIPRIVSVDREQSKKLMQMHENELVLERVVTLALIGHPSQSHHLLECFLNISCRVLDTTGLGTDRCFVAAHTLLGFSYFVES